MGKYCLPGDEWYLLVDKHCLLAGKSCLRRTGEPPVERPLAAQWP